MNDENKKEIISIIQARMSSKRLPGKVLLPLGKSTILNEVINKAKGFSKKVIVCTSKDKADNAIENFCESKNILCVRGDLENVFSRYQSVFYDLKNLEDCKWFARLTADNPLISVNLAKNLISKIDEKLDYIAYKKNIPNGSAIELINKSTFLKIKSDDLDKVQQEHVTPFFYENKDKFNILFLNAPKYYFLRDLRITVDYEEDYKLVKELFEINQNISLEEVIELFKKDLRIFHLNKNCIQNKIR
tara:strand:- start:852 stop:1589 length:738 start_codon:yes stop_codon:yes gene_type:complete